MYSQKDNRELYVTTALIKCLFSERLISQPRLIHPIADWEKRARTTHVMFFFISLPVLFTGECTTSSSVVNWNLFCYARQRTSTPRCVFPATLQRGEKRKSSWQNPNSVLWVKQRCEQGCRKSEKWIFGRIFSPNKVSSSFTRIETSWDNLCPKLLICCIKNPCHKFEMMQEIQD